MSLISIPNTFTVGAVIIASQHNSNFSTIYSDYNGNITDANMSASAALSYTKLSLVSSIKNTDIASNFNTASGFGVVPSGGIIMWSGTIATIPTGWYLCNGSNGTPDLRNRFVVCADADSGGAAKSTISGSATQSGGSATKDISHTHTIPNAGGTYTDGGAIDGGISRSATNFSNIIGNTITSNSGGSATQDILNPYYALAYIMKS